MKIGWKVIRGFGPYAYLQKSVRNGDKVTTKHIKYLGKSGEWQPGTMLTSSQTQKLLAATAAESGQHSAQFLKSPIPAVDLSVFEQLKPGPQAKLLALVESSEFPGIAPKAGAKIPPELTGEDLLPTKPAAPQAPAVVAPNKSPLTDAEKVREILAKAEAKKAAQKDGEAHGPVEDGLVVASWPGKGNTQIHG